MSLQDKKGNKNIYSLTYRKINKQKNTKGGENKKESKSIETYEQTNQSEINENIKNKEQSKFLEIESESNEFEEIKNTEKQNKLLGRKIKRNKSTKKDERKEHSQKQKNNKNIALINIGESESEDGAMIEIGEKTNENLEEKKKRTIYISSYNQTIKESDLFNIFKIYGTIAKIQKKSQYSGLIEFNDEYSVDKVMNNKNKIFFKRQKLKIQHSLNIINEQIHQKKREKMEEITQNKSTIESIKKKEKEKEKIIDREKEQGKKEINDRVSLLEERVKKLSKDIENKGELISKNSKEIRNLKISLNIMGQINEQKDIHYKNNFDYLHKNLRLLLNSYKILYIRKLANLLLEQIYKKYSNNLGRGRVQVGKNKHNIFAMYKGGKKEFQYQLNLLIDFLRFIWDKSSDIIHIKDKNFPLQKELFYEYLKPIPSTSDKIIDNKGAIEIGGLIGLIFENKKKQDYKENKSQISDNNLVSSIKEIIKNKGKLNKSGKNTVNLNDNEGKSIILLSDSDESDESSDEFDEKEIKNIITKNLKEYDMNEEMKKLVILIKKNQKQKKIFGDGNEEISGNYFYNLWKKTFHNEQYKMKNEYNKNFKKDKIVTLKQMGDFVCNLLAGMKFNLFIDDPQGVDNKYYESIDM